MLGAGDEPKGDAFAVIPAGTRREPAPEAKPTQQEPTQQETGEAVVAAELTIGEPPSADVIAFMPNPDADAAVAREAESLVTVRAKPEKRKNAKERAKDRARAKGKLGATEEAAVTAEVVNPEATGLATAHPKPEKRKNARERAKEKYAKTKTEDGTTPDTTAKAKSKVKGKAETKKAKKSKAA